MIESSLNSPPDKLVTDWKFTSVWAVMHQTKEEWTNQLNIYAHLLRANGREVDAAQIGAFCTDWRKGESLKYGADYPPIMYMPKPIELKPDVVAGDYIRATVAALESNKPLPDAELPLCTKDERWLRGEKWAVMKGGRKSAVRLLDTEAAAWEYITEFVEPSKQKDHSLEHRPGANVRCEDYCDVCEFCSFWKEKVNI